MRWLLVAVLVALLAAPALALGAPRHTLGDEPAEPSSARLQLEGSGVVRLQGRLVTFGLIPDDATLWVRDYDGDARFFLDGEPRRLRSSGVTRLRDVSGRIYLSGTRVMLQIRAEDLSLSAAGRGIASVSGNGEFSLNDGRERAWPARSRSPLRFAVAPARGDRETPSGERSRT